MTTHQGHRRRPAVWALLAITLTGVLAGLTTGSAVADPAPSGGKLVLVLDSSGSMKEPAGDGQTKIAAARTALTQVVTKLPTAAEVGLRVYGATVFKRTQPGACTDTQLTVPIGTNNRPQLQAAIAKYKPYGETPIGYALQQAAKDLGPVGQRTIVLVSDGEATCAPDPCVVAQSIAKQGIELKIDVVGFRVAGKARTQLQCVAREGRGDYYDADSTLDLEAGLDRLSTRAFRPFRISGTPVHGGPQQEGAPTLAPGHYSDTFGNDQTAKYYLLKRTMANSTLRAGVSFRRPSGGSFVLKAEVFVKTIGGENCGWSYPLAFDGDQGIATGAASSWTGDYPKGCSTDDQLVLTVSAGDAFREMKGVPYELRVDEEPPVEATTQLPPEADDPTWTPMPGVTPRAIVPGSSFADAPLITPGSFKTTLMPGEVQLYRIKADWGQRIQAQATVPKLGAATAKAIDGIRYLDMGLISPLGEDVIATFAKQVPGNVGRRGVLTKDGVVKANTTKEIRYLNRDGANTMDKGTAVPGEYYIALSVTRKDDDKPFAIPMTLTVALEGTAGTGKPTYVDGATPVSGDSITPTPTAQPSASETPGDGNKTEAGGPIQGGADSGDGTPVGLIAGLGGGGVLLLLIGVLVVLRLRAKPAAAQATGTSQHGQHQYPSQYPNQGSYQQYPNQAGQPQYPNQGGRQPYPNQGGQPPQQPPHR
ncbi:VWA domain-containing protein [Kribbella pratensis]|uniref:Ca-activated chloride channel family protein n=1 Tax=Kribbella pratensis TaxID=2512112 RepID=A0A4R8BY74_9ACTN|nr:VWA domain-containing protein [Kribbella pratensis]TDW66854.1 Ca-activated chloride channel family protein [Kribbella pratensis]